MSNDTTPTRICGLCGKELPLTTEFYYQRKDVVAGWRRDCIQCQSAKNKAYHANNKDRHNQRSRDWRAANLERYNDWHKEHAAEKAAYKRKRYWENPERERERTRLWREANPEKALEKSRQWESVNRDRHRATSRLWNQNNRERVKARNYRRRAIELSAEGTHTADDIKWIFQHQDGECAYCGIKLGAKYHVDHVIPLSRGGTNYPENLACTCPTCNLSKNDRTLLEWMLVRGW